jgi:hypothetical protein
MRKLLISILALSTLLQAGEPGSRVQYVGGTVAGAKKSDARIELTGSDSLSLSIRNNPILIPYKDISTVEYGLRVSRRYVEAALISPVFLIGRKKTHFVTIGFTDSNGQRQVVVLQVGKEDIRALLVSLEARTGLRVEYQDEEARKAGKG